MTVLHPEEPITAAVGDPIVPFETSIGRAAFRLDNRSRDELISEGTSNPDPAVREQALYQLLDRYDAEAIGPVEHALLRDPDPQLRVNLLWALQGIEDGRTATLGTALLADPDPRVREWARVLSWEIGWTREDFRQAQEAHWRSDRTFDETIFLHIQCHLYVRMSEDNSVWAHLALSPQMLARVYGQALACPISRTRERELVICKTLSGLHDDGSDHYECFLFRGVTERKTPDIGNFFFEAHTPRPFYLSGKADDLSEGVVENVTIPFARQGQWITNGRIEVDGHAAIEYVRGRFQGWAYVNVERILSSGTDFLFPGNSVLSTLHHPAVAAKTNAFFVGSFKGKVLDWDGDGILDLNYLPAHATVAGEVDSNLDGIPDVPGMTVCSRPFK